jgi:hypothetical protein
MIPGANTAAQTATDPSWYQTRAGQFLLSTAGSAFESEARGKSYHTFDSINVASKAAMEFGGSQVGEKYFDAERNFNYTKVTEQALFAAAGALIMGDQYINMFGQGLGSIVRGTGEEVVEAQRGQSIFYRGTKEVFAHEMFRPAPVTNTANELAQTVAGRNGAVLSITGLRAASQEDYWRDMEGGPASRAPPDGGASLIY